MSAGLFLTAKRNQFALQHGADINTLRERDFDAVLREYLLDRKFPRRHLCPDGRLYLLGKDRDQQRLALVQDDSKNDQSSALPDLQV